jgi:hypothetical protein
MTIKTAQDWWASYAQNIPYLRWIAGAVLSHNELGLPIEFTPLQNIETFSIEKAYSQLQNIWAAAPDRPVIRKWKGWGDLCDLCSEFDREWIGELNAFCQRVEITSAQQREIDNMLSGLHCDRVDLGPNDLVAGGWVRDLLSHSEPNDIDVFAVLATDTLKTLKRPNADDAMREMVNSEDGSGSNPLISSLTRLPTEPLETQVIEVGASPAGYIRTFDAFCNMLAVDRAGLLYAYHPLAAVQARLKIYQRNPIMSTRPDNYAKRVEKFRVRWFNIIDVDWPQAWAKIA